MALREIFLEDGKKKCLANRNSMDESSQEMHTVNNALEEKWVTEQYKGSRKLIFHN